jgi:ABC-type phosphate/phosphonate transport system substrate-binding protein
LDRDQTFDEGMQKISQLWREPSTRSVTISARELAILDGRPLRELRGAHQLTFGVNADDGPASMAQRYARWLGNWQEAMAHERKVSFQLRIFKRFEPNADALQRSEVDLLVMNAAEFVRAEAHVPHIQAFAQARGSREGVLFGRLNAGITNLSDLPGKRLALPDPTSTLSICAKARLVAAGWKARDFSACHELPEAPAETGAVRVNTTEALDLVLRGEADAGVTYRSPFERHRHLGLVLLERFVETPQVLAIRSDLPAELKSALRNGLRTAGDARSRTEGSVALFVVPTVAHAQSRLDESLTALRNAIRATADFSQTASTTP